MSDPVTPVSTEADFDEAERPRFSVEVPTLKSLYIEIRFGEMVLGSGTAVLVAKNKESHCALITNRHVVTGRHQETDECLNKEKALPDNIIIHFHKNTENIGEWTQIQLPLYREDGTHYWIEHPRLGAAADIVALNLRWGSDLSKFPYYFDTEHDRHEIVVSPAETVSVIGFPFGLSSTEKFPIWATGFLAQELSLVRPEKPYFLIDCRARQGQSGSAVIAFRTDVHRRVQDGKVVATLSSKKIWEFLGVYSGRLNAESDLGKVWHVSAIEELLSAAAADMEARAANKPS